MKDSATFGIMLQKRHSQTGEMKWFILRVRQSGIWHVVTALRQWQRNEELPFTQSDGISLLTEIYTSFYQEDDTHVG